MIPWKPALCFQCRPVANDGCLMDWPALSSIESAINYTMS